MGYDLQISSLSEAARAVFDSRQNRHKATIAIQGEPTVDPQGRLHAPCNGYIWEDEIYAGGEYLAVDNPRMFKTVRYLTRTETVKLAKVAMSSVGVDVKAGSTFGDNMCYAYFNGPTYIINKMPKLQEKKIVEAGTAKTGKTWKFSYKRWLITMCKSGELDTIENDEFLRIKTLDKKMVGYYRPILTV